MKTHYFHHWSLKSKVTLFTLTIFLASIWSLTSFASRMLREDITQLLHEQQFTTVSIIASDINTELNDRMELLEKTALKIIPAILGNAALMQTLLEDHLSLGFMFNGGAFITGIDGTAIASIPLSANRRGVNFIERDHIFSALKMGNTTISKPVIGKLLLSPVVSIAAPIRDAAGIITGTLAGVIDLSKPNFLDKITDNRYGKSGGYILIAPQHKLIVTASDKSRIMQPIPAPGINPLMDRYLQGFEGSGRIVDSRGQEVLSSAKQIPAAGWIIVARIPVKEAFAPVQAMQNRMYLAAVILTLLAGGLVWWLLKRQLSPVFNTLKTLSTISESNLPVIPLPVVKQDEVGQLIGGFNHLLEALSMREDALKKSEEKYRTLIDVLPVGVLVHRDGKILLANKSSAKLFGFNTPEDLITTPIVERIHPDYRNIVTDRFQQLTSREEITAPLIEEKLLQFNGTVFDAEVVAMNCLYDDKPAVITVFNDITERKLVEEQFTSLFSEMLPACSIQEFILDEQGMPIDYITLDVNRSYVRNLNVRKEDITGKRASVMLPPAELKKWLDSFGEVAITGKPKQYEQFSELNNKYFEGVVFSLLRGRFAVTFDDVTDRKLAENKIRTLLSEKEIILKEVHHRIKNNMNIIYSLLNIQSQILTDPAAIAALHDAGSRVQSMAVLYDKLYKSADVQNISVMDYVASLIDEILANFPNSKSVKIIKKIDDFILDTKRLQTIGIAINEILTNIMKYAFVGRSDGLIVVEASLRNGSTASFVVQDNGIGLPPSINFENSTGFGLELIAMMTNQLNGNIRIERENGTRIVLEFEK